MMRGLVALGVVVVVSVVGLAGVLHAPAPAIADEPHPAAPASCGARLGTNVYKCTVLPNGGGSFTDCLRFSAGAVSDNFDVTPDQLGVTLGCTCKAGGSKKKPKFGGSPAFECNADQYAFEGVVSGNGKAIVKGFASTAAGASFVFSCKADAACAIQ